MKKTLFVSSVIALLFWSCGPDSDQGANPGLDDKFEFTVTVDSDFTNKLPKLQSFVFAAHNNNWMMFSGRTIGFHGFNGCDTCSGNFPASRANDSIYVYDVDAAKLYSMVIPGYGGDTANVFRCTNLEHTAQGDYLYACGGYGIANATDSFASKTYSYFMKINLPAIIAAVKNNDASGFKNSILWGKSDLVRATGGELYVLPDGNFYLTVGHIFTGTYLDTNSTQVYLNQVNVFSVANTGNQLAITKVDSITDGLNNTLTQFHRRDLVVAPAIQPNGTDIGISIYGGVFTYTSGPPSGNAGNPFSNPIYINYKNTPKFRLDTSNQYSNIYSTAFLCMYDDSTKCMMTTFFGGLGDTKANFADANWTNYITTAKRSYANSGDVTTYNQHINNLPGYFGAESVFIPASGLPYSNSDYKILDYSKLSGSQLVGYIYGGIHSSDAGGDNTWCSDVVYKVVLEKLQVLETAKK